MKSDKFAVPKGLLHLREEQIVHHHHRYQPQDREEYHLCAQQL